MKYSVSLTFLLLLVYASVSANIYYVSPSGSNSNDGKSEAQAFRIVQYAVDQMQEQLSEAEGQVARVKDPDLSSDTPASELLGAPAGYWLDLRGYDPAAVAKDLPQPMLILQGGRDYQVTEADYDGWQAALGDRVDVTLTFYPDLNHLFMTGEGMATPAEYERPGNVAQEVVDDIATWVLAH